MARKKTTPEEIKLALKKEIIRLGIEDNPSRTVYQKQYERGTAPSPNNAMNVTGMKWQELMKDIGFDYDGKKNKGAKEGVDYTGLKATRYNYDDPEVREEIMNKIVTAMDNRGYTKLEDLKKNLKKNIGISYITLARHGFTWGEIILAYKKKYGKPIVDKEKNSTVNWDQFTNKELLDIVTKVVKESGSTSLVDYDTKHRARRVSPSSFVLMKRFGVSYTELWRMIQINGDLPIK